MTSVESVATLGSTTSGGSGSVSQGGAETGSDGIKYYQSLDEFIEDSYGYYLRLFRRRLYDPQDAEDMAQRLFLKVWRAQPALEGCWQYTKKAAHRLLLNYYRDTGRDILWEWPEVPFDEDGDLKEFPDETIKDPHERLELEEAWQSLTEQQQEILILVYFQGYSHREASQELNTYKTKIHDEKHKALEKMREYL